MGTFLDNSGVGVFTVPGDLDAYMLSRGHTLYAATVPGWTPQRAAMLRLGLLTDAGQLPADVVAPAVLPSGYDKGVTGGVASLAADGAVLNAAGVKLVAKGELVFNVKDYGATGDGSTNDTAAIIACFNAARAARPFTTLRPVVLFPMGTYITSAQINVAGTVIHGYNATLKSVGSGTGFIMLVAFGTCSIFGLTIDGNKANTAAPGTPTSTAPGIYLHQGAGGYIGELRDVTVNNCHGPAVRVSSTTQTDAVNALNTQTLIDNLTSDGCLNGVWVNGGRNVTVTNSHITNTGAEGIWFNISRAITITNNVVDTTGVTVTNSQGIADFYCYGSRIIGNHVRNTKFAGIAIGGGSTTLPVGRRWVISGNVCEGNWHHGITIDPTRTDALNTSQIVHGVIAGNICNDNGHGGSNGNGIYVHNAADVAVTGNTCFNNYLAGIVGDGIRIAITGNVVTDNLLYGIELRSAAGTPDRADMVASGNVAYSNGSDVSKDIFTAPALTNSPVELRGTGAPNGVYVASVGSTFRRIDGGASTSLYVKESGGSGNTGWVAK